MMKLKISIILFMAALILLAGNSFAQRAKPQGLVNLDFQDADIKDVVKSVSEITGKNFIMDDRVRGKVTIISPTPVTIKEAYQAFLSALEIKNYTVVPGSGRTLKIVPLREAKSSAITTISEMETPYGDTFITRLIPIKYISSSEIVNSLKALGSPNGSMSAYGPTNTIIITDTASNIRRLMKIIGKLDKEGSVEGVEVIPLKHASAQEIAQKLLTLFPQQKEGSLLARALAQRRGQQEPAVAQSISRIIPDDRTNSLIIVANRQGLERVLDIVKRLDVEVRAQEGKGRIHVHYLEHADSEELAATLSSLSTGQPSRRKTQTPASVPGAPAESRTPTTATLNIFEGEIRIASDIPTNSLVITASGQDYESLKSVIAKLDIARPQVFVEALIMEVNMTKNLEAGITGAGGGNAGTQQNPANIFGATQFNSLSPLLSLMSPGAAAGLTGMAVGLQGRTVSIPMGQGNAPLEIPIYGALFRAYQKNGVFNIISTPNIMTTDNKEAEIVIGKTVPVKTQEQQSSVANANIISSYTREEIATKLKVTPQINESDFVTLDIYQEVSELAEGSTSGLPITNKRSAKTTVVVQDSQTVVIGGLIKDSINKVREKVPILGDIPLLGLLFRKTSDVVEKINLMIFITPHIIHTPMDQQTITIKQNEKRRQFNKYHKVDEHPGVKGYGLDKSVDFNSVRPPKTKPSPVERETEPPAPLRESDVQNEGIEVDDSDSGPVSRSRKQMSTDDMTQVRMKQPAKKTYDDSFFKEERTAQDFYDSDYISEDLLYQMPDEDTPKPKKRKTPSGNSNPFDEVDPPSSQ